MRMHRILTALVMLAILTLPFVMSSNAFAKTVPNRPRPYYHEVFTGRAFPPGVVGYPIRLDAYYFPGQPNFAGYFTEGAHNQVVSYVTGYQEEAEFDPGVYFIQFTIEKVLSGTTCLYCQYTGDFTNSQMIQAKGSWQSPTGQILGQFYLNETSKSIEG